MVTTGILPHKENPHGRAGNRTRDLVIISQKLWPLDHEAGHMWSECDVVYSKILQKYIMYKNCTNLTFVTFVQINNSD